MRCICWKHDTVTTWGCPECRAERLDEALRPVIEETNRKIEAAFAGLAPKAVTRRHEQSDRDAGS